MFHFSRRCALKLIGTAFATASFVRQSHDAAQASTVTPAEGLGLGFSLYGMKSLSLSEGMKVCAEIGYDCIEIPVLAGWPADSKQITGEVQKRIRQDLVGRKLRLSALMENLLLICDEQKHAENLERLKLAAQLAHSLSPKQPAVVETVLGGSPAKWAEVKASMVDRLGEWAAIAASTKTVFAIKPHVANAMHTPQDTAWVIQQINSPWLKAAFDYSHFALRKIAMERAVHALVPQSVFVHVKDETGDASKFQFLLPGAGSTDYAKLLRLIYDAGYRKDIVVEVSGQIHSRAGYDPVAAAKSCYESLSPAFEKAQISRRRT